MPRRVRTCNECYGRFVAATTSSWNEAMCPSCRQSTTKQDRDSTTSHSVTTAPIEHPQMTRTSLGPGKDTNSTHKDILPYSTHSQGRLELSVHDNDDNNDTDESDYSEEEDDCNDDIPLIQLASSSPSSATSSRHTSIETNNNENDSSLLQSRPETSHSTLSKSLILMIDSCSDGSRSDDDEEQGNIDLELLGHSEFPTSSSSNMEQCIVCGSSLTHIATWKGRVNHYKRCSKQHAYNVRDFCENNENDIDSTTTSTETIHHPAATVKPTDVRPSAFSVLMDGAKRAAAETKLRKQLRDSTRSEGGGRWGRKRSYSQFQKRENSSSSTMSSSPYPCPQYKKIPGTDFICDGFKYKSGWSATAKFFLTHFHADHYGGITKSWNAGVIYCSQPTANLVHQQLGVPKHYLHPLPMLTPTAIVSQHKNVPVTVTLLDANHCPGAVMFLFQVGSRSILHVGDFRWNRTIMQDQTPLQPFFFSRKCQLDELFLDTTYCDPRYKLPTQQEAIQGTIEVAVQDYEASKRRKQRILLLFGAYTIGKERIYLAVAERLGLKVYVDRRRYRILSSLSWPQEILDLLTTRPEESCLWVVPLGHINMKKLPEYQTVKIGSYSATFDKIVGFRPTGWSLSAKGRGGNGVVKTATRNNITVHSVPYSEHSSFPELVDCLRCLKPTKIVPTVNASRRQEQIDVLMAGLKNAA